MTSLICAISNEVPENPVVSPVSGQVYERRLIEKFLADNGVDPINKEPLSEEQLIEIKCSPLVKPKPPSATSIPAILKSLQVCHLLIVKNFVKNVLKFCFLFRMNGMR